MSEIAIIEGIEGLNQRLETLETQDVTPIVARYTTDAGQSIPNNTLTIINFEDQTVDTRSAVTVGAAWKFTAPVGGFYRVSAKFRFALAFGWAYREEIRLELYKNGTRYSILFFHDNYEAQSSPAGGGCDIVQLAKDDTIDIRIFQESGAAKTLDTNEYNFVAIERITS